MAANAAANAGPSASTAVRRPGRSTLFPSSSDTQAHGGKEQRPGSPVWRRGSSASFAESDHDTREAQ
jgi:hypothetical protein